MNLEEVIIFGKKEKRRKMKYKLYRDILNNVDLKNTKSKPNEDIRRLVKNHLKNTKFDSSKSINKNSRNSKVNQKLKELNALDYRGCVNNKSTILYFYKIEFNTINIIAFKSSDKNDEIEFKIFKLNKKDIVSVIEDKHAKSIVISTAIRGHDCFRIKCVVKNLREELMTTISKFSLSKEKKHNNYIKL